MAVFLQTAGGGLNHPPPLRGRQQTAQRNVVGEVRDAEAGERVQVPDIATSGGGGQDHGRAGRAGPSGDGAEALPPRPGVRRHLQADVPGCCHEGGSPHVHAGPHDLPAGQERPPGGPPILRDVLFLTCCRTIIR